MEMNPYAAPQVDVLPSNLVTSTEETIRKEHLRTEASIKSIGFLYYLSAFSLVAVALMMLAGLRTGRDFFAMGFGVFFLLLAAAHGTIAYGLRRLKSWSRIPTIVFACLGLLSVPVGTIVGIYILVTVAGKKGRTVLSPDYRRIMELTPHLKYKTPVVAWVLLTLLILALVGVIVAVALRG